MQSDYRLKESRLKFLIETEKEKEGYSKSVKSLLIACDKNEALRKCSEGRGRRMKENEDGGKN